MLGKRGNQDSSGNNSWSSGKLQALWVAIKMFKFPGEISDLSTFIPRSIVYFLEWWWWRGVTRHKRAPGVSGLILAGEELLREENDIRLSVHGPKLHLFTEKHIRAQWFRMHTLEPGAWGQFLTLSTIIIALFFTCQGSSFSHRIPVRRKGLNPCNILRTVSGTGI